MKMLLRAPLFPMLPNYTFTIRSLENFQTRLDAINRDLPVESRIEPSFEIQENWFGKILFWILPVLLILGFWLFLMRRMGGGAGGAGGQIFNIGKSKATLFDKNAKVNVTFADVAGLEEAKEEVMEVVDFLKNPKKYTALGGKIPKGVLLVGPPGTGKTLIGKSSCRRSGCTFFLYFRF